ncbi:MAG: hypothetical protein A2007_00545 [Verrucomicrobia bacterium GWC2_42_7]|nr:MAG: hypothetical protein A2007_00545 [Verrucomicrobia bacterium GWC2_42_7]
MPIYLYQEVSADGTLGEVIEIEHAASLSPLAQHPETGVRLQKVYVAPGLTTRYTPGRTNSLLENKNLEKKGFTKYQRDKVSGKYYKVAGKEGPTSFSH